MEQKIDQLQMHMLEKIADLHGVPEGAYNNPFQRIPCRTQYDCQY